MLIGLVKRALGSKTDNEKVEGMSSPVCPHMANGIQEGPNGLPMDGPYSRESCVHCQAEEQDLQAYRWKLIFGLLLPYALQALDVTIVASALPYIAEYFNETSQLNWIIAAFNLTSAAFIPFWAQVADIFGRHLALQSCSFMMLVGSALCTGAPQSAWGLFLLGRAIQGIGCAGLNTTIRVVLADKVTLQENARNWSLFTLVGGIAYGIGPALGGALTETDWRWCFAINLPVAVASMVAIFYYLRDELLGPQPLTRLEGQAMGRRERFTKRITTIDAGGQLLFLFGFGLLVLALTWAGANYPWSAAAVLVPLVVGALIAGGWVCYEYLMAPGRMLYHYLYFQKPMMPWELVRNRNVSLLLYINIATGMAMYSVLYFADLYFSYALLKPAKDAGTALLLYTPGLGAGVYLSMYFCNSWPRQTFHPLFLGSIIEAIGVGLMAWAMWFEKVHVMYGMIVLTGAGTGLRFMPCTLHAIGFFPNHKAAVVSIMEVAFTVGGTTALTLMSTVFNNTQGNSFGSTYGADGKLDELRNAPPDVQDPFKASARNGITWAYVALTPFMVICIFVSACLGNVDIAKNSEADEFGHDASSSLTHGSYLMALSREQRHDEKVMMDRESQEEPFAAYQAREDLGRQNPA